MVKKKIGANHKKKKAFCPCAKNEFTGLCLNLQKRRSA